MIGNIEKIFSKYEDRVALNIDGNIVTYKKLLNDSRELSKKICGSSTNIIVYGHKEYYMIVAFIACIISKKTYIPIDISIPTERVKKIIEDSKSKLIVTEYDDFNLINILENNFNFGKNIESDISYIIYTSGSTGSPKGVPIRRYNLDNFINWISNSILRKYDKLSIFNQSNFNFDLSVMDIYYSLFNGHTLVITNKNLFVDLDDIYNILKKHVNMLVLTPSFVKLLMINIDFNENNFNKIKCMFFCGEVLDTKVAKKLYERFPNIEIINAYGPTEATCAVSLVKITKDMLSSELPIGEKNSLACNVIIDNEEIVLSGKSVFEGYLNSDEKITNYRTGDYGYFKDNKLYFTGRCDDTIKLNGYRINLNDIRNNILSIEDVDDAVVYVINKNSINIFIEAKVVTKNKELDIKEKLSKLLPKYMIPKRIYLVDELKLNNNMKKVI